MNQDEQALKLLEEMYSESARGVIRSKSFDLTFADRLRAKWDKEQAMAASIYVCPHCNAGRKNEHV